MTNKRDQDEKPLMYITQPGFEKSAPNMQNVFIIKSKVLKDAQQEQSLSHEEIVKVELEQEVIQEEVIESAVEDFETVIGDVSEVEAVELEDKSTEVAAATETVVEEITEETTAPPGSWKSKPFKEMSNEEKLHFVIHRPHYIPKIKCQIRTNQTVLTGYVVSHEHDEVAIKIIGKARPIVISFDEIIAIQMVGL
ncbi:spore coat CotO family protein [Ectobacillus sp. JY-23]|uniref:CotO family spore coat protein n=1 Tax=Ectobacillus sp. JY-23 TaxID=2933872 RepID=UPI001FF5E8D8|nr:CotO family spore coat protein [Ectobacillus sp. JY-23]UOY92176.1 spore coat CotO family protein [Ectobacillus sp. JY-23]